MTLNAEQNNVAGIDEIFKNATRSIADAESFMTKAKPGIEKAKASKDGRSKVVSKAGEVVNALLEPASKVADLLKFVGNFYPPCGIAGSTLQGIVDIESGRRENDVRIGVVYVEFSTSLVQLGSLKPGFEHVKTLLGPLEALLSSLKSLMEEFGQFCESFYEGKSLKNKFKHLILFKPNSEKLDDFHKRLASFKGDLTLLLTQQAVLITSSNTSTLKGINDKIDKMYSFFAGLKDESETVAEDFVVHNGGEDAVLKNEALIEKLAQTLKLELTSSVMRAVKEGSEESFRQSYKPFQLKLQFAIESRIEVSTETIIREIRNGPYELIEDPDMKAIWKGIAPKESNLKRRQFVDAMVYYFNTQWKQYKVNYKVNKEDFWARSIITKVYYQPAIGDAIDDDASGYISVEEVNEFMRRKPSTWTVPQWVSYWAYGWDGDNLHYRDGINKAYKQLESISEKAGPKKAQIKAYLDGTQEHIQKIANSLFGLDDLDTAADTQMKKLQEEWRTLSEKKIKERLREVNFKIGYDSMAAVCGSDRIEVTLLPLVSQLLSRHVHLLSQDKVKDEDIEEAKNSMLNILGEVADRITILRRIWMRQRQDVEVQVRYYVNGLFQDYYKAHVKDFEADLEDAYSDWDSDDEWGSDDASGEDPGHGQGAAVHTDDQQQVAVSQARSGSRSIAGPEQRSQVPRQIQQTRTKTAENNPPVGDEDEHNARGIDENEQEGEGENEQEGEGEGEQEGAGEQEDGGEGEGEGEGEGAGNGDEQGDAGEGEDREDSDKQKGEDENDDKVDEQEDQGQDDEDNNNADDGEGEEDQY